MNRFSRMPHWCRIGACALLLAGCVATSAAAEQGEILWPRKTAEQGDAEAQFNLGNGYYNGQGVPQDHAEAARWYRKAAEQGLAAAQVNLGFMYHNGQGVPQDDAEAARWSRKAAEQRDAEAQNILLRGIGP